MAIILSNYILDLLVALATIGALIILYYKYTYTYWSRRSIPFLPPKIPLGNTSSFFAGGLGIGGISKTWYDDFKRQGHKYGGIFQVLQPTLLLVDPDYVRDGLSVDFKSFTDRGFYHNESDDPLSTNLFTQDSEDWRKMRVKITPTFTSGKMKTMFESMIKCSKYLEQAIEELSNKKDDVDIHEVAACFTTDVIGSCAFGLDCDSFKDPDAPFRAEGKRIMDVEFWQKMKMFMSTIMPKTALKLGVCTNNPRTMDFFSKIITETIQYREENKVVRPDFLQNLIEMKNTNNKLTMNEIIAQCFVFFAAGFETSSTTMMYTMLEVAQNMEAQEKIRKEITEVLNKYNGEITYDGIMEMKYLAQAIDETLRLYPPVSTLNRVCTKDYKLRNSNDVIKKGTPVLISILGLQRDGEYWPQPYKWDPERFSEENKKNHQPYTYIPFGEGPRNCIGLRFGLMQTKIGLVTILKDYKVTLSPKTILPVGFNPDSFALFPLNRIYIKTEKC